MGAGSKMPLCVVVIFERRLRDSFECWALLAVQGRNRPPLLPVIVKECPVRQTIDQMIAPAMLDYTRLPHG